MLNTYQAKLCPSPILSRTATAPAVAALAFFWSLLTPAFAKPTPIKPGHAWYQQLAWTTEAWTRDDTPYKQVRKTIDGLIVSGQKPAALLSQYQAEAQQHPSDPQRQFAWAYVAYDVATARQTPHLAGYDLLLGPKQALGEIPPNHIYEYDRLRFLVYAFGGDIGPKLKPVGKRLLLKKPGDAQVKLALTYLLDTSEDPAEQQQAFIYAQDITRADSTDPTVYMVSAGLYMSRWLRHHNKGDADRARDAYQQWLRHAPLDDAFRQDVIFHLQTLQRG